MLLPGDPAPTFTTPSSVNDRFTFDTVAGRYVVLSFICSTTVPFSRQLLDRVAPQAERYDVKNAIFFAVSVDGGDREVLRQVHPGLIYFWDEDQTVSRLYDVASPEPGPDGQSSYSPRTFVLDPALRVIASIPFQGTPDEHLAEIARVIDSQPPLGSVSFPAPVLIVPGVFEPAMCRALIDYYETHGGEDSGFMRDINGRTVGMVDYAHKRRMDCEINDDRMIRTMHNRLHRRVIPAIKQAYQFDVTRIERHIVACYDAEQGAHFRAHRDNTTLGTAHRRFAVTINLNSPDYDGGEIWFPEFGPRRYKAPSGAAIVFSCSLLHEVPKVTRGKRYAFLPFLYDEAAAALRDRNWQHLGDLRGAGGNRAGTADCNAAGQPSSAAPNPSAPVVDGRCGCGNPEGCGTCLSAATYTIGVPRTKSFSA